jgi:putative sterol carrier protein
MTEPTIQEFIARMPEAFIPEKAVGVQAGIQLKLTGAQAGDWYVTIQDGKCTAGEGSLPSPNLTLTADAVDFIKIFTRQMDGMQAFMQGKLKLAGDMSLALKLMNLFKV